jgi:hypothetical protein
MNLSSMKRPTMDLPFGDGKTTKKKIARDKRLRIRLFVGLRNGFTGRRRSGLEIIAFDMYAVTAYELPTGDSRGSPLVIFSHVLSASYVLDKLVCWCAGAVVGW